MGAKIFNVLVMLFSAYFVFKIAKKLNFRYAFPTVFLVIFSPVYLRFSQSALTEPLFGLVAIIGVYLFLNKRYITSAVVISFIIFARSEGMMFLLLYAFAFVLKKQYKAIPYLLLGFVIYGFLGLIFNHGFFWYYYDYPYNGAVDLYGKGPFWNYFIQQEHITGTPFSISILFGLIALIFSKIISFTKSNKGYLIASIFTFFYCVFLCFFIRNNGMENAFSLPLIGLAVLFIVIIFVLVLLDKKNRVQLIENFTEKIALTILIVLPAIIYVFAHSYMWYKGIGSALGLHRIVGAIFPLLAVLALFGFNKIVWFLSKIPKIGKIASISLLLYFGFVMVKFTYEKSEHIILIQPDDRETIILETIAYIKDKALDDRKMYVYQAHFISAFDGDHFDRDNSQIVGGIRTPDNPTSCTKKGDIIIWDGHVSPNEGRLPIENLENNVNFKELKMFRPKTEYMVLGGFYYIKIFERI
jgi:hypothetical protein